MPGCRADRFGSGAEAQEDRMNYWVTGLAVAMLAAWPAVTVAQQYSTPEKAAKRVEGVTSVKNQLQVVAAGERKAVDAKDDDLTKSVKDRLKKDARLKGSDVEVRADKGVVTLTGEVKDLGARARASEVARGVPGVRSVKNELKEKQG